MSAPQQSTLSYYPPGVSLGPQASPSPSRQQFPNLGSNNPFRTRTLSPSSSTHSGGRPERPRSTNPFLDDIDPISPQSAPSASVDRQDMTQNTTDLFENLSLNPAPKTNGLRQPPPRPEKPSQNGPLKSRPPRPPRDRSENRSENRSDDPFNIFADPPKKPSGSAPRRERPRRNSESSIMERTPKLLDDEDERRRRERRRRDREARHKDGKSRSKKTHYQLDIIDKLDVTSIYGTGMFHHDGPFDACNPNRNRKGLRAAPMQAFPKDSTNMALGGAGPNNDKLDLDRIHGRMQEGYNDFGSTGIADNKSEGASFDPTSRIDPVHGQSSMGLGTSTFLDGAPASRSAIRENQTETTMNGGGLARKKSLAQRLRGGINRPNPRVVSPQAAYGSPGTSSSPRNEKNPFFQDYDDAYDKKGARINAEETAPASVPGRMRSSSSPKQRTTSLTRQYTDERVNGAEENKNAGGGGFISRMKSLRKPPQPRRRVTDD
ncbi:Pal1 cell morphology protein-domain-containing protein [Aspergillus unguis]